MFCEIYYIFKGMTLNQTMWLFIKYLYYIKTKQNLLI